MQEDEKKQEEGGAGEREEEEGRGKEEEQQQESLTGSHISSLRFHIPGIPESEDAAGRLKPEPVWRRKEVGRGRGKLDESG